LILCRPARLKARAQRGGFLEFGTELVAAADCSLVALLGHRASTAVFITSACYAQYGSKSSASASAI